MTAQNRPDQEPGVSQISRDLNGLSDIVSSIVETMQRGRIERLVVTQGDFHLELESTSSRGDARAATPQRTDIAEIEEIDALGDASIHVITSPMIGTFYTAPAPGEPPFVKLGDTVAQGDTIGIVEAMKIMNEIAADRAGVVTEITAANGETVEYGSPLIHLELRS